jgi:hypothetical protein
MEIGRKKYKKEEEGELLDLGGIQQPGRMAHHVRVIFAFSCLLSLPTMPWSNCF